VILSFVQNRGLKHQLPMVKIPSTNSQMPNRIAVDELFLHNKNKTKSQTCAVF
jgi:hypothetical protein